MVLGRQGSIDCNTNLSLVIDIELENSFNKLKCN